LDIKMPRMDGMRHCVACVRRPTCR
jgi:hypothetical protein